MNSSINGNCCNIADKDKSCCTIDANKKINIKEHWNRVYLNSPVNKLGWYETDHTPMMELILKTGLNKSARIAIAGAGSTTLVDELLDRGYSNIIATDISEVSLQDLKSRIGNDKIEFIVDDLTKPIKLKNILPVDLWIDRAVLHFFIEKADQNAYFALLKSKIRSEGFVILAEYNLDGAKHCAGLPVCRFSKEILMEKLGENFKLVSSFEHTYTMPSGAKRPYIYALFKFLSN